MQGLAAAGIAPKKLMYLWDEGGKGKSMLSLLLSTVWGHGWRFADANIMQNEDEFRKSADRLHGARFIALQEKIDKPLREDTWKRCIAHEEIAARPNYGKETNMLTFGTAAWFWEVNDAPRALGDQSARESFERRVVVGRFKLTLTAKEGDVKESDGIFKRDTTLDDFFRQSEARAVYMHDIFMSFCEMYSLNDCRHFVDAPAVLDSHFPGSNLVQTSKAFVARMFGESVACDNDYRIDLSAEADELRNLLVAREKARFTLTYVIKDAALMKGTRRSEQVSRFLAYFEPPVRQDDRCRMQIPRARCSFCVSRMCPCLRQSQRAANLKGFLTRSIWKL